jgi:hypothetical protein
VRAAARDIWDGEEAVRRTLGGDDRAESHRRTRYAVVTYTALVRKANAERAGYLFPPERIRGEMREHHWRVERLPKPPPMLSAFCEKLAKDLEKVLGHTSPLCRRETPQLQKMKALLACDAPDPNAVGRVIRALERLRQRCDIYLRRLHAKAGATEPREVLPEVLRLGGGLEVRDAPAGDFKDNGEG